MYEVPKWIKLLLEGQDRWIPKDFSKRSPEFIRELEKIEKLAQTTPALKEKLMRTGYIIPTLKALSARYAEIDRLTREYVPKAGLPTLVKFVPHPAVKVAAVAGLGIAGALGAREILKERAKEVGWKAAAVEKAGELKQKAAGLIRKEKEEISPVIRKEMLPITERPIVYKYVQFKGSPDVFETPTGKWLSHTEALRRGDVFKPGAVLKVPEIRPDAEVEGSVPALGQKDIPHGTFNAWIERQIRRERRH